MKNWVAVALLIASGHLPVECAVAAPSSVDVSSLSGRLVVGFQGWFMCPGDSANKAGWWHWFTSNTPDASHVHFDLLPDVSELDPDELCATNLKTADGRPVFVFSDQNPKTVLRQFQWMRTSGIETVALQRFIVDIDPNHPVVGNAAVDNVLQNVRTAAEATGRSFFVMYDIVGADPNSWADTLARDWAALVASKLTLSPSYQRHHGAPVLAIGGVGSNDRPGTSAQMAALISRLRGSIPGGVTLIGETATNWRTLDGDSKTEPAWSAVYRSFDILSPWTVGRYSDSASFQRYVSERLIPDVKETQRSGIQLMPVLFPGFSWANQSRVNGQAQSQDPLNQIPRQCGTFMQMQADAYIHAGVQMLYGAMFDEVDEGTAIFKMVSQAANLPAQPPLIPLSDGACRTTSSDFYLNLTGTIAGQLKAAQPKPEPPANLRTRRPK